MTGGVDVMLASVYAELINLPRPVSRRQRMDVQHRAKQFAPFAALREFEETVRKKEIVYETRKELSEEKKRELDIKLGILSCGMRIQVTFFAESPEMPGKGQYHTIKGDIDFFDPLSCLRIKDTEIRIADITDLSGDIFEIIEFDFVCLTRYSKNAPTSLGGEMNCKKIRENTCSNVPDVVQYNQSNKRKD